MNKPKSNNLLSIFLLGSEVRQFVHSGLFTALIDSDWSITVMAKFVDEDIKAQLPDTVKLIPLLQNPHSFLSSETTRILDKAFKFRQLRQGKSTWQYGKLESKNWRQSLLFSFENFTASIVSRSNFLMSLITKSEKRLFHKMDRSIWREYFTTNPTDAILVNVPRSTYWDPFLITAEEMGIDRFLVYHTSKDITANGRLKHPFTGIGVWNSTMKKQLVELNPWVNTEIVHVVGCGHFDCVGRKDWLPDERIFRSQIGASPDSILVLYPTAGPGIVPQEERYIQFVANAAKNIESVLHKRVQIVFRMNPMDNRDVLFEYLQNHYPEYIVLRPDWQDNRKSNWTYARKSDPILYNALLHYSSLCITIPSTVTIDCALAGIPVINLGIEVPGEQPLAGSIQAFWDVDFNRNVRETNAARYVTNEIELEKAMLEYLQNNSLDDEKREALVLAEVDGIRAGHSSPQSLQMINSRTGKST